MNSIQKNKKLNQKKIDNYIYGNGCYTKEQWEEIKRQRLEKKLDNIEKAIWWSRR